MSDVVSVNFSSLASCSLVLCVQRQRTVYRLTLVKAWNVVELKAYSELIALGQPDFIEVKVGTHIVSERKMESK